MTTLESFQLILSTVFDGTTELSMWNFSISLQLLVRQSLFQKLIDSIRHKDYFIEHRSARDALLGIK